MLSADEKALITRCFEALKQTLPGFTTRRAQLEMVAAVAQTFGAAHERDDERRDGSALLVCQSPTGTGKTAAYLAAGIALARSRSKQLIVSTSTVALQAQLAKKDLPVFEQALPVGFTWAIAKGRNRYVCAAKLLDAAGEGEQRRIQFDAQQGGAAGDPAPEHDAERDLRTLTRMAEAFAAGEWNGDKDALDFTVSDGLWSRVITDRQGCTGNKCPRFGQCAFYAARQKVKEADVVIANHDLVLCALEMPAGTVLPDPAQCLVVFDEAHALKDKGTSHFAEKHALRAAVTWIRDVPEVVSDLVHALRLDAAAHRQAVEAANALVGYLEDLYQALARTRAFEDKPARRFKDGVLPDWAVEIGENILGVAQGLVSTLTQVREAAWKAGEREPYLVQRLLSHLGFYLGKLEKLLATWELMLAEDAGTPTARWVERYRSAAEEDDFLICASPISGAEKLARLLWSKAAAVVLTSATLTSCGSFDLFLRETGLKRFAKTRLLELPSPFDYANRARLVVPRMRADPRQQALHTEEVIEALPRIAATRGTLVLFASGRQMREVHAKLPAACQEIVLMQGTLPKMEIVARHRAVIEQGGASIIFGLASFAEGVDLPGEYCTHVVIAKLPFSVPSSPLEEARREWVEKQGGCAFLQICVPEVGVRLNQGVGRLLRTEDDYGTVTILDRRIATTHWGRMLLKGLPPFRVEIFGRGA